MYKEIACLEITSYSVKLMVGYVGNDNVYVLHCLESTYAHLVNGHIQDKKIMSDTISELVKEANKALDLDIDEVILGLPSYNVSVKNLNQSTACTSETNISENEGNNLVGMLKNTCSSFNDKFSIVDIIPKSYALDNIPCGDRFPYGKKASFIGIDADVILMDKEIYSDIVSCVKDANLEVSHTILTAAASVIYLTKKCMVDKEHISDFIFIDIQETSTILSACANGRYFTSSTYEYGLNNFIEFVKEKLNVSYENAQFYVETFGISNPPKFNFKTKEGITIQQINETLTECFKHFCTDIYAFVSQITDSSRKLFILSGKGCLIQGLQEFIAKYFENKTFPIIPQNYGARNPSFTNLLGMIWYDNQYDLKFKYQRKDSMTLTRTNQVKDLLDNQRKFKKEHDENMYENEKL